MQRLRALCDEHGIMLIADEVQSSARRTGTLFAMEQMGVAPELAAFAKSIRRFPLAGVTGRAEVVDAVAPGGLGGASAGNRCLRSGAGSVKVSSRKISCKSKRSGAEAERPIPAIAKNAEIGDVRGLGAMIAIELFEDGEHHKTGRKTHRRDSGARPR
ncbi:aminotransferase class III-fold pyridoxal phosphate-dependent enzyme [Shigella sonnei]